MDYCRFLIISKEVPSLVSKPVNPERFISNRRERSAACYENATVCYDVPHLSFNNGDLNIDILVLL